MGEALKLVIDQTQNGLNSRYSPGTYYLQAEEVTVLHLLQVRDVGLEGSRAVELTDVFGLKPEIEGVASWLRPTGLTTTKDPNYRQVFDLVVQQALRCQPPGSIGFQAVHTGRDAHLTGHEFDLMTAGVS